MEASYLVAVGRRAAIVYGISKSHRMTWNIIDQSAGALASSRELSRARASARERRKRNPVGRKSAVRFTVSADCSGSYNREIHGRGEGNGDISTMRNIKSFLMSRSQQIRRSFRNREENGNVLVRWIPSREEHATRTLLSFVITEALIVIKIRVGTIDPLR